MCTISGSGVPGGHASACVDAAVMAVNRPEEKHEQRYHQRRDPRSFGELRDDDDDGHHRGRDRADGVDREAASPARLAPPPVVHDHARLRQRERHEEADREQRDERADFAAERDEQNAGGEHQHEDPVREHEAVAPVRELPWKEFVARDDARQAREVRERGVGRQRENRRGRDLQEHVERSVPEHLAAHDRQQRLVGAQRGTQMGREHRDAEEQRSEDHGDPGQA